MGDRHSVRAEWHDYNSGIYFITICTVDKQHIFGNISSEGKQYFTKEGIIVNECLVALPTHHENIRILNHVVMPNHIHMVLSVGAQYFAPALSIQSTSVKVGCFKPPRNGQTCLDNHFNSRLAVIIRSFKAACTIEINRYRRAQNIAPLQVWQRNYHEHIIRNQIAFDNIMNYVSSNVANWSKDCFYS